MSKTSLSSTMSRASRHTVAAMALAVLPAFTLLALPELAVAGSAQELPPHETPTKKTGKKRQGTGQQQQGQQQAPQQASLLLSTDLACSVTIDGTRKLRLGANSTENVTVSPGQHLVSAVSDDGQKKWEQVVETKGAGQQTVVKIPLGAAGGARPEDFDRAAARVWLAITDLKVAGSYASAMLDKSFGFHNKDLSTALFTAQQYIKREVEDFKKYTPPDANRKRFFDAMTTMATTADQYVDLLTKAIAAAQQANSWLGEPHNMYSQARALEKTMVFPPDVIDFVRKSEAFKAALPVDRLVRAGLARDPRDFDFGAEYYASTPRMIAVVYKKSLADDVGFKAGDLVVSANGQPLNSVWDLKLAMRQNAGRKLPVVVEREGRQEKREIKVPSSLPQ